MKITFMPFVNFNIHQKFTASLSSVNFNAKPSFRLDFVCCLDLKLQFRPRDFKSFSYFCFLILKYN